jgi:hypothetical protein
LRDAMWMPNARLRLRAIIRRDATLCCVTRTAEASVSAGMGTTSWTQSLSRTCETTALELRR